MCGLLMCIFRHLAADIFVDTFVYGAHSTATDSIRGVSCQWCLLLLYVESSS